MGNTWTHLLIDGAVAFGDGSASTGAESWLTDSSITVLRRIRRILRTERQWYIRHVSGDLNHVIDCLANMSLVGKTDIQVFDGAPD
ncbi:hypothetical protein Goari_002819 [Gossypium aridum]|uniref:RNase H type-1 domain-containing protein n=1 Tax=Gossypium aridum TaxID=34290 RepID=A0A7J8Y9H9_GOSAI|nr:hypothetical protein [Gossypium aridum]